MRREFASILIGIGFAIVSIILPYWIPNIPNWIIYSGLGIGAVFIVVGFAMFFWKPKKQRVTEASGNHYENSPITGGDHFGDSVYGNKIGNFLEYVPNIPPERNRKDIAHKIGVEIQKFHRQIKEVKYKHIDDKFSYFAVAQGTFESIRNDLLPHATITLKDTIIPEIIQDIYKKMVLYQANLLLWQPAEQERVSSQPVRPEVLQEIEEYIELTDKLEREIGSLIEQLIEVSYKVEKE